ncbi:MAG: hypothetical protein ACREH4_08885 [Vitreimonas sp.]
MTNRQVIDWRRWVAMLCIALVAVFAFDLAEAASPCENAGCTAACDMGACDDPGEDGAPCSQHHSCHGGAAASAPSIGASVAVRRMMSVAIGWREVLVAAGYLDTLERPPRAATVV